MIRIVERDALGVASSLGGPARFGVADQDLAHQPRRGAEEMSAVLPIYVALVYQPQKCLVNQSRRLERMAGALATHVAARHTAQFAVDERRQFISRALIASIPRDQKLCDFFRR